MHKQSIRLYCFLLLACFPMLVRSLEINTLLEEEDEDDLSDELYYYYDQEILENNQTQDVNITIGNWDSDCLDAEDRKFPAINLQFAEKDDGGKEEIIRVNRYYGVKRDRFFVRNNGLGVLSFKFEAGDPTSEATIRVPGLTEEYVLAKGDIVWSLDTHHGAQHALNGKTYPLEMHLVHYLKSAESLEKAASSDNGIFITSVLFEEIEGTSPNIEPLAKSAVSVGYPNEKWKQVHGPLDIKTLYPLELSYATYKGKYLHEPCAKMATWFVFRDPLPINKPQLMLFQLLRTRDSEPSIGIFLPLSFTKNKAGINNNKTVTLSSGEVYLRVEPTLALNNASITLPQILLASCFAIILIVVQ